MPTVNDPMAKTWFKIGCLSFGGAAAQIALLHREFVEERRLIDERSFLHALNLCMLLPGPEAQQLATYLGWRFSGVSGGLIAGILFVFPGAFVMLGLSTLYVYYGAYPSVASLFFGLKCAVLSLIIHAVIRLARRAFINKISFVFAFIAFLAMALTTIPFPILILAAAISAYILDLIFPSLFGVREISDDHHLDSINWSALLKRAFFWLVIWFSPLIFIALSLGMEHRLFDIGLFFAKLASLSFGGAYALLAWLAQTAVETKSWLSSIEMSDGLGLAETTPGPTILVTQFVGFLAAHRAAAPLSPLLAAIIGSALTVWMTFAPSFLFIFAGAPLFERLRTYQRLASALKAITSIVVGVIAWVGVWFALHLFFANVTTYEAGLMRMPLVSWASFQIEAVLLSSFAALMFFLLRWPLWAVLMLTILAGSGLGFLGLI
ncbi:MAG: chromate efflux transporter [Hyphomicrobiales bacterium]